MTLGKLVALGAGVVVGLGLGAYDIVAHPDPLLALPLFVVVALVGFAIFDVGVLRRHAA
jgi:hypothetical protein